MADDNSSGRPDATGDRADPGDPTDPDDRDGPNVLVVLTDQQRWDTVGAYGSPMDLTPNLDAMADRGVQLERAFTSQPLCAPTRGMLQTGQYGTESGLWKNHIELPDVDHLLARTFRRGGYRTGYVGKWHLATTRTDPVPADRRAGYEDVWRVADVPEFTSRPTEGTLYDENDDPIEFDDYRVDAYTDEAIDAMAELADGDDPFFLFLSYLEPHHQNDMETFVAPDGYAERYGRNPYVPPDLREKPGDWYPELPDYYGICKRIDECFGRLLDALDDEGIADDTVVLFASDHGCHFRTRPGEYKRSCHEGSIRVPAVLAGPGFDDGDDVDELVSLIDVPPTLIDAAGLDVPDEMQGDSVVPLVDRGSVSAGEDDGDVGAGEDQEGSGAAEADGVEWKDEIFVQISESEIGRAIRTDRWKYAVAAPAETGWEPGLDEPASDRYVERYLYDLHADPYERINLVDRPEYADVRADLRERLLDRMADAGEDRPDVDPFQNPGYREY